MERTKGVNPLPGDNDCSVGCSFGACKTCWLTQDEQTQPKYEREGGAEPLPKDSGSGINCGFGTQNACQVSEYFPIEITKGSESTSQ